MERGRGEGGGGREGHSRCQNLDPQPGLSFETLVLEMKNCERVYQLVFNVSQFYSKHTVCFCIHGLEM